MKTREEFLKKTVKKQIIDFDILAPATKDFDGMVQVKLKRNEVQIKSPRYIGCTVLWWSKILMLDFIYNCLYTIYNPKTTKVLYMDTDSVYLKFSGDDAPNSYDEFASSFPLHLRVRHFIKSATDVTPGVMKCEKVIKEAILLRPKCYCLLDIKERIRGKVQGGFTQTECRNSEDEDL